MLTIDRLRTDLRLAGGPEARDRLARRLDRIAGERIAGALEEAAAVFGSETGEVIRVRRVELALWLDTGRLDDAAIARRWAETLARALWRQLAHGGPSEVRRWPHRGAYLAAWAADHAAGRVEGRWDYAEFRTLADVPTGRAVALVLGRDPRWIGPVFAALAGSRRSEAVIAAFRAADVAALWRDWTGGPPRAPAAIAAPLLARIAFREAPEPEAGGADARARMALRWLVALTQGPGALPPEVAAGPALQLAHLGQLVAALPELGPLLRAGGLPGGALRQRLATAPEPAAAWFAAVLGRPDAAAGLKALATLAAPAEPPAPARAPPAVRPERIAMGHAGLALLLPALRGLGIAEALGANGRHALLSAAIPPPQRSLARGEAGLRWLSGLPPEQPCRPEAIDWPPGGAAAPDRDIESHGTGAEMPLLRLLLDRFAAGLRGMEGSSAAYLARQFLARPGRVERTPEQILVRLDALPLRVLLSMAGRLGEQGPLPWLEGRRLVIEAVDG